jgi:Zn-finger nucleic acid-binding protein
LTELAVDPSAAVHACTSCGGVFVPARAWHLLSAHEELVRALAPRLPPSAATTSVTPLFECAECGAEMDRIRFAATSQVVVNVCTRQDGLWLDAGELAPALAYAKRRRSIGAVAAAREAEAIGRSQPGGDPDRLRHEGALAVAREREARAGYSQFAAPPPPEPKRRYMLFVALGIMALFYISLTAKDCSKHRRSRPADGPDTDVKTLQQRP